MKINGGLFLFGVNTIRKDEISEVILVFNIYLCYIIVNGLTIKVSFARYFGIGII